MYGDVLCNRLSGSDCVCSVAFREGFSPISWRIRNTARPRSSRPECWLRPPAARNPRTLRPDRVSASDVWIGTWPTAVLFSDQPPEPCTAFYSALLRLLMPFSLYFKHVLLTHRVPARLPNPRSLRALNAAITGVGRTHTHREDYV